MDEGIIDTLVSVRRTSGRSMSASVAHRSAHAQRGIERPQQLRVAEWLEQALQRALFEQAWADGLICVSRDEDDRNLLPVTRQLPLQIWAGRARYGDVENEAFRLVDAIRCEERFSR